MKEPIPRPKSRRGRPVSSATLSKRSSRAKQSAQKREEEREKSRLGMRKLRAQRKINQTSAVNNVSNDNLEITKRNVRQSISPAALRMRKSRAKQSMTQHLEEVKKARECMRKIRGIRKRALLSNGDNIEMDRRRKYEKRLDELDLDIREQCCEYMLRFWGNMNCPARVKKWRSKRTVEQKLDDAKTAKQKMAEFAKRFKENPDMRYIPRPRQSERHYIHPRYSYKSAAGVAERMRRERELAEKVVREGKEHQVWKQCEDWDSCYGKLGIVWATSEMIDETFRKLEVCTKKLREMIEPLGSLSTCLAERFPIRFINFTKSSPRVSAIPNFGIQVLTFAKQARLQYEMGEGPTRYAVEFPHTKNFDHLYASL
jgi:hypothetical protein